jgi:hydrogenase nickel incorporation protein HypA/HybF
MHELGIASEIVALAAERSAGAQVARVVLEVGVLSAVLPDALRFCFELASQGTELEGAELEVIELAGRARCLACGTELTLRKPLGQCACGCSELEWLSGDELRIREMEVR